jgi:hypothetical protein
MTAMLRRTCQLLLLGQIAAGPAALVLLVPLLVVVLMAVQTEGQ